MDDLKPCPFCGEQPKTWWDWKPEESEEYWEGFNIECCFAHLCCTYKSESIELWNTRHEEKPRHRVMVVGDDHDRIPLIEAINQIGFDGIIIADKKQLEPIKLELPERCSPKIFRENNATRCGYSTKRK